MADTLTLKQEAFCREYVVDLNATAAAIRAGYAESGAQVQGSRLLSNVIVQRKVNELTREKFAATGINAEMVLARLRDIAYDDSARQSDQIRALELLGKHLQLFIERHEIDMHASVIEIDWSASGDGS